ncbi:MAG: hypothetical protein U9R05_10570 [Chloroflexota bacterium]|nr:hypothetical protein [Chloroflexota bacterium]
MTSLPGDCSRYYGRFIFEAATNGTGWVVVEMLGHYNVEPHQSLITG